MDTVSDENIASFIHNHLRLIAAVHLSDCNPQKTGPESRHFPIAATIDRCENWAHYGGIVEDNPRLLLHVDIPRITVRRGSRIQVKVHAQVDADALGMFLKTERPPDCSFVPLSFPVFHAVASAPVFPLSNCTAPLDSAAVLVSDSSCSSSIWTATAASTSSSAEASPAMVVSSPPLLSSSKLVIVPVFDRLLGVADPPSSVSRPTPTCTVSSFGPYRDLRLTYHHKHDSDDDNNGAASVCRGIGRAELVRVDLHVAAREVLERAALQAP